jgi:hypothetical protein
VSTACLIWCQAKTSKALNAFLAALRPAGEYPGTLGMIRCLRYASSAVAWRTSPCFSSQQHAASNSRSRAASALSRSLSKKAVQSFRINSSVKVTKPFAVQPRSVGLAVFQISSNGCRSVSSEPPAKGAGARSAEEALGFSQIGRKDHGNSESPNRSSSPRRP